MNVHHLELFYYVAKHGGISEAVRNIPYGIQQPAVSGQIIQLEEFLGVTLFQRRPFSLTPAGQELFDFVRPFFGRLDEVADKLQGGVAHQIRIGASEAVLRDHLPDLVANIRRRFPVKLALRSANQPQLEALLDQGEIDLAITLIQDTSPPGIRSMPLIRLPLILLVPKESKLKSAEELWQRDRIDDPLIALPPNEIICRQFQATLNRKGIDWFTSLEVNSLHLIEIYVEKGFGIGLSMQVPMNALSSRIRAIELPDFPPVTAGVLWRGKPTSLTQAFLDELQKRAKHFATNGSGILP